MIFILWSVEGGDSPFLLDDFIDFLIDLRPDYKINPNGENKFIRTQNMNMLFFSNKKAGPQGASKGSYLIIPSRKRIFYPRNLSTIL